MFSTYSVPCSSNVQHMSVGESKDAEPIPIIIDTDIGDDIDDAFCLMLAFKLHKDGVIKLLCVITSGEGSHEKRAELVHSLQLSILGSISVPIYMGSKGGNAKLSNCNYMPPAAYHDFLKFEENLSSVVDLILAQAQKVRLVCIGPLDNIAVLLDRLGDRARSSLSLYLMGGCFGTSFDGIKDHIAEYNVRKNPDGWRNVVSHMDATIVPLDIAGDARFKDWELRLRKLPQVFIRMYTSWYRKQKPTGHILRGTMPPGERPEMPGKISSVMFDGVALCVALHPEYAVMVESAVEVTDDGHTNLIRDGPNKVKIALAWQSTFQFDEWCDRNLTVEM